MATRTSADTMVTTAWTFLIAAVCLLALWLYLHLWVSASIMGALSVYQIHRVRVAVSIRRHWHKCDELLARLKEIVEEGDVDEHGDPVRSWEADFLIDQLRAAHVDFEKAIRGR